MKSIIVFALFFSCLFFSVLTFAQGNLFVGKLVNEQNVPMAGATVKIFKSGKVNTLVADQNGVFSADIPAGDYYADIYADGRIVRAKKIYIQPAGRLQKYYNFKLNGKGVVVSIMVQSGITASTTAQP